MTPIDKDDGSTDNVVVMSVVFVFVLDAAMTGMVLMMPIDKGSVEHDIVVVMFVVVVVVVDKRVE